MGKKAVSRVPEQSGSCRYRHHPTQGGFHFRMFFPVLVLGALLVLVFSTQKILMEKWGWLFVQIGDLKVPDVAQLFLLVRLDAETVMKAHTSSSTDLPALNRSRSNCLMNLFMFSRLGKLGYVCMKFCPVTELNSQ